jgi:hypothetical protein
VGVGMPVGIQARAVSGEFGIEFTGIIQRATANG